MVKGNRILFFVLLLVCPFFTRKVASQTFNFKNYNINEGLPQSYINSIDQSDRGNLWIGTGEGLSKFDGKNFTNYTIADGIAENFVTASYRDKQGNMWFGHYQGGLTLYDRNAFRKVDLGVKSQVNAFCEGPDNSIFVGTQREGLLRIKKDFSIKKIKIFESGSEDIEITTLYYSAEELLVGTSNGIFLYSTNSQSINLLNKFLPEFKIQKIQRRAKTNSFLIGTVDNGLYELTKNNKGWSVRKIILPPNINESNINIIYEDLNDVLWIGAYGEGVSKFKISEEKIEFVETYNESTGLSNNFVKSFFVDREGNVWLGTFGSGLDLLLDPLFSLYTVNQDKPTVTALYSDDAYLWVGNENGLSRIDPMHYINDSLIIKYNSQHGIPKGKITSLTGAPGGEILIGTEEKGIYIFSKLTGNAKKWYSGENQLGNRINHLTKDKSGNIWISTPGGAIKYNAQSREFKRYSMEDGLGHNNINSIFVDSKDNVWFASNGAGMYSLTKGVIKRFSPPKTTPNLDINCITEDNSGMIWVGTYGQGLFSFNGNEFVKRYTSNDGIGSNYCYLLSTDVNNNLWIGHKTGLSKLNITKQTFTYYHKKIGYIVEEVNSNAVARQTSGNMWFGTINGLLKYNVNSDKTPLIGPLTYITGIRLFFQEVDWSIYTDSLYGLARLPANLILPYNKNHFTFNYISVNLSGTEKVQYQYKLEGFEKEWSLVTKEDFVTYSNLPPGKYTMKARAHNGNGIWSETNEPFSFAIRAPFWASWWFILLAALMVIFLVYTIVKLRTESLRKQREKLQISEEKLIKTNKELNTFIYRSSHDLRGPLSTVKGLTQVGIMELKDENALKYLGLISDRVNRLDSILKELINIVEITEGEVKILKLDFSEIVEEVIESQNNVHVQKNIQIIKSINPQKEFYSDRILVITVLRNLIENSIRYNNIGINNSYIEIHINDYKKGMRLIVSDNGFGIAKDLQDRVFDMFFRGTEQSKGSGLGLYVTKKIIEKLEGTITLTSTILVGTQIEIYLPNLYQNTLD